ncbi:MAG: VOC family protein [Acidimicrobiales bacterium]
MALIRFGSLSLDCADPLALGTFWAEVLGGEIAFTSDDFVAVKLEHVWLSMLRVENYQPTTWPEDEVPKQMHLDLAVGELEQSEQLVVRLGAKKTTVQPQPDRWRVFLDPAGHPFCLTTQIPE